MGVAEVFCRERPASVCQKTAGQWILGNASNLGLVPSPRMKAGKALWGVIITTCVAAMFRIADRIARGLMLSATFALLLGAQPADLSAQTTIFADGFESGDTSAWGGEPLDVVFAEGFESGNTSSWSPPD